MLRNSRLATLGLTLLLVTVFMVSACGQKGPLYLPKESPDTEQADKKKTR